MSLYLHFPCEAYFKKLAQTLATEPVFASRHKIIRAHAPVPLYCLIHRTEADLPQDLISEAIVQTGWRVLVRIGKSAMMVDSGVMTENGTLRLIAIHRRKASQRWVSDIFKIEASVANTGRERVALGMIGLSPQHYGYFLLWPAKQCPTVKKVCPDGKVTEATKQLLAEGRQLRDVLARDNELGG